MIILQPTPVLSGGSVLPSTSTWLHLFRLPESFSTKTMEALQKGGHLDKAYRRNDSSIQIKRGGVPHRAHQYYGRERSRLVVAPASATVTYLSLGFQNYTTTQSLMNALTTSAVLRTTRVPPLSSQLPTEPQATATIL